ncbi:MAG TPA: hypothetical protein VIV06_00175 [Candidatus Limnocylindrales bacterium]
MRKRKVTYPIAKTAKRPVRNSGLPGDSREGRAIPTVATIDLTALDGRDDLVVGDRVRIGGDGLYAGEFARVESLGLGGIPAAIVRTDAGRTRRVRVVDLEHAAPPAPAPIA